MNINTKKAITQLNGKPYITDEETKSELTIGEAIAECLGMAQEGGQYKMYILAKKFYEGDVSGVDKSDLALVKTTVEKTKRYNVIIVGQILEALNEAGVSEKKDE